MLRSSFGISSRAADFSMYAIWTFRVFIVQHADLGGGQCGINSRTFQYIVRMEMSFQVAIQTVLSEARHLNITAPQLERLALEFKQEEVDEQLKLPPESSSRTLRASAEAIAEYQGMEATALADAAVLRQKAS